MSIKIKKEKRKKIITIVFLSFILVFFLKNKIFYLTDSLGKLFYPLQSRIYILEEKAYKLFYSILNYEKVLIINDNYKKENMLMKAEIYKNKFYKEENERLKKLLVMKENNLEFKVASVTFRHISDLYKKFYIDLGKEDGIKDGMIALVGSNLVGKIEEIYSKYSVVKMITSSEVIVSGLSNREVLGIITSNSEDETKLKFLSSINQDNVEIGDEIFTSGISDIYDKGLSLGKIIKKGDEEGVFIVEPNLDLLKISEILIMSKKEE
ncbi:MAG: rod shape-determining protein MreC [Fusobacteriaceae bacterium]